MIRISELNHYLMPLVIEIYSYFDGNISLEGAIDKIKQNSRHYAKRQYTFFNHQLPVVWF